MNVLAVIYDNRVPNNDRLYEGLARHVAHLEVRRIDGTAARNLREIITSEDAERFDRIVIEIRAKHALAQAEFLRGLPNLVLFEEDTWQNYARFTKNFGFFTTYYAAVQPKRIIHTGFRVAALTRSQGFDSVCLPKGYDGAVLSNDHTRRDIETGFIGRVAHANYVRRRDLLQSLERDGLVTLLRTHSAAEYRQTLNRIRTFVSADVGFGEHMIKNFEAMACGCALIAHSQPEDDEALGLKHGDNVMLYSSEAECRRHIEQLARDPDMATEIGMRGQRLAEQRHDLLDLGGEYAALLATQLGPCQAPEPSRWRIGLEQLKRRFA